MQLIFLHKSLSCNNYIWMKWFFDTTHLSNVDRYTQLVEQFAAVSYGDELFGHFVLVPLQQCHSPSYRKLVWSEYAAILRVLRTRPEQVISCVTDYMKQSPSWEANRPQLLKKFPAFYGTWRFIEPNRSRPCPPPPRSHFSKIHFNIILSFMPGSSKWSPSLRFPH
jgi:hypothetical protein